MEAVPVAPDAPAYNATLVSRADQTGDVAEFRVRRDDDPVPFEPGQYMTLGVVAGGQLLQRPYSMASAPGGGEGGHGFHVRRVPGGAFTDLLWQLPVGHRVRLGNPKGRFVLGPDDGRTHLFIATGTGIAPFVSMLRAGLLTGRSRRTVILHGTSHAAELGYRDLLERWERDGALPLRYVPTISRPGEARNAGWNGRTGRAEEALAGVLDDLDLAPAATVAYLCGNPGMVSAAESLLLGRGFAPADVRREAYWAIARPELALAS